MISLPVNRLFKIKHHALAAASATMLAMTAEAAPLYVASFQATFDSGFGGLPNVVMRSSYTFEALPATRISDNGTVAYFENHIRSASSELNGVMLGGSTGYIRVDNNIPYGSFYRDMYVGLVLQTENFGPNFVVSAIGVDFELVNAAPTAFTSLNLPLSTADLNGFASPNNRLAVLVFQNLTDGIHYATYAPLQQFSITPVPEPSGALFGLGACVAWIQLRRSSRTKCKIAGRRCRCSHFPGQ